LANAKEASALLTLNTSKSTLLYAVGTKIYKTRKRLQRGAQRLKLLPF
jgi:hypothetical protein